MIKISRIPDQRGITLVIGLIMLALITIVAVMAFNLSQGNLKIVSNAQHREEGLKSAQEAIDQVISAPNFITDKGQPVPPGKECDASRGKYCTDVDKDGTRDFAVTVTATCMKARAIYTNELDIKNNVDDVSCLVQDTQLINPLPGGQSLCAETVWNIGAEAADQASSAKVVANQGVAVRVSIDSADTACK